MSYSLDVNGNDNEPEWGYCKAPDCREEAFPIWESGGFPDEPHHLLCPKHIGNLIGKLETQRRAWTAIGAKAEVSAAALRVALQQAQDDVCSLNCPSVWKTADGPPPHSDKCQAISTVLAMETGGSELLRDLEAAYHALQSYAHSNSAPALAVEMAEHLARWIGKAGSEKPPETFREHVYRAWRAFAEERWQIAEQLEAELEAARAVVKAATLLGTGPDSVTWTRMYAAVESYEAMVKAREK